MGHEDSTLGLSLKDPFERKVSEAKVRDLSEMVKSFFLLRQPVSQYGHFGQIQPKWADTSALARYLPQNDKGFGHFYLVPLL